MRERKKSKSTMRLSRIKLALGGSKKIGYTYRPRPRTLQRPERLYDTVKLKSYQETETGENA